MPKKKKDHAVNEKLFSLSTLVSGENKTNVLQYHNGHQDHNTLNGISMKSSNGYSSQGPSSCDGSDEPIGPDVAKTNAAIDDTKLQISWTKNLIKEAQTGRDQHVNEYLRLAMQADRSQLQRIKCQFEKKNQKSALNISNLQKKLDGHNKRLRELEIHGVSSTNSKGSRNPKGVFRSVMSKPRKFAHLVRNKFGSADNINHLSRSKDPLYYISDRSHSEGHGSQTLPNLPVSSPAPYINGQHRPVASSVSCVARVTNGSDGKKFHSDYGIECCSSQSSPRHKVTQVLSNPSLNLNRTTEIEILRLELENFKTQLRQEQAEITDALQEERFRNQRLEKRITDLTVMHQTELAELKRSVTRSEEKISNLERQLYQQQNFVTLENIENSHAHALFVSLVNIFLTVLQVVLLFGATVAGIAVPFMKTRVNVLTTGVLIAICVFVFRLWPTLQEVGSYVVHHYKQALIVK